MSIAASRIVWERSKASGSALVVLLALADHANDDLEAWPAQSTLARLAKITDRQVRAILADLVAAGDIEVAGIGHRNVIVYRIACGGPNQGHEPTPTPEVYFQGQPPMTPEAGFRVDATTPEVGFRDQNATPEVYFRRPRKCTSDNPSMNQKHTDSVGARPSVMTAEDQPALFGDQPGDNKPPAGATTRNPPAEHPAFATFWSAYPGRGPHPNPRKPAAEKFAAAVKHGADPAAIIRGAENYAATVRREGTEPRFVAQAVTWLNQHRWQDHQAAEPDRPAYDGSL